MVPLIPEVLPNLGSKHILISAGLHDPIVPNQDTKNLLNLLKKAGAETSINWQNSGHELGLEEIKKAKDWLFSAILPNENN
jgi:predicted esterase